MTVQSVVFFLYTTNLIIVTLTSRSTLFKFLKRILFLQHESDATSTS